MLLEVKKPLPKIVIYLSANFLAKNINKVRLTRYTLLSWAPLSLLFQFKRAANIYFLIISILSFMSFSPKVLIWIWQYRTPFQWLEPLSLFLRWLCTIKKFKFSRMKEAYEDFQRYKMQKTLNEKKTKLFSHQTNRFELVK